MARYLFVVPPFFGHINPTLGIGSELINRGHKVIWVGLTELACEFIPAGGVFIVPQELNDYKEDIEEILRMQDDGTKIRGLEILRFTMEATYIPFCIFLVKGLLRVIDKFQPNIIIHDENMFAGAICATIRNIPYVTSIAVPPGTFQPSGSFPEIEKWQTQQIINLQQKFGIAGKNKIVYSNLLNLVYTSKEFVGNGASFPEHYKFVGPIINRRKETNKFDFEKLHKSINPIIYVSIGTLLKEIRKEFFAKIIEAFAGEPLTVIVATNPDIFDTWPDNFIVQTFVPQSDLLPYVNAVIYHGGFNTVNEALFHGIPMLIIPMAYDQFHIASLVVNSGSGLSHKYKRLKTEDLRKSLRTILEDSKYKQAALKVGETLQKEGGIERASNLLENILTRRAII